MFLLFFAELDIPESFKSNLFLIQRKIAKYFLKFFEKLQVSNAKTKVTFFKKKSWSQMIQICLIRREMAKKKFGGRRHFSAVAAAPPPFLQFSV